VPLHENGKHTLRAMKENARRGYMNGSKVPYGYHGVEVEGAKVKKETHRGRANRIGSCKTVYHLYLYGKGKGSIGTKEIATFLNNNNVPMRIQQWNRSRVHEVLSNTAYIGEYCFNKANNKTQQPIQKC
jgi:site-specific DNA recombinase